MKTQRVSAWLSILAAVCVSASAQADIKEEVSKLLPSGSVEGRSFSGSLAMSGATTLVGLPFGSIVYVFDTATGQQLRTLSTDDGSVDDAFGLSIAVDGTTAIIGAPGFSFIGEDVIGAAYVFDVTTGAQLWKLTAGNNGEPEDRFGQSVAISGTTALVSGPIREIFNNVDRPVYVYDVTTGQELRKLLPDDGAPGGNFGAPVALSGSFAVVGASAFDSETLGSVYVFDVTTGEQICKLLPDDGAVNDAFGSSIAISGSIAVIGANLHDDHGKSSGAAYVFDLTTGKQLFKLLPGDVRSDYFFGTSVAVHETVAVISALGHHGSGQHAGAAYVFDVTTGNLLARLLASDGAELAVFGGSVAVSGTTAIVTSRGTFGFAGVLSTYVFDISDVTGDSTDIDCEAPGAQRFKLLPQEEIEAIPVRFGSSVAVNGTRAVVGAAPFGGRGPVYIFDTTTGEQLFKLLPEDAAPGGFSFGRHVQAGSTTALVSEESVVHIFDLMTGEQLGELTLDEGAFVGGGFGQYPGGNPIAMQDSIVIVGSPNTNSAYVFDMATRQEILRLLPSDGESGDVFGISVATNGTTAIVGAWRDDNENGFEAGSAYVFDLETGQELYKLIPSYGRIFGRFGSYVALNKTTAVVTGNCCLARSGSPSTVFVFDVKTGEEILQIFPDDDDPIRLANVVMQGTRVIIGAYLDSDNGFRAGAVYVFDVRTGEQLLQLFPRDGAEEDEFGRTLAISGTTLVVGAPANDDDNDDSGSTYVFTLPPAPIPADLNGDGCVDAADLAQLLGAWGTVDIDGNGITNGADLALLLGSWRQGCS